MTTDVDAIIASGAYTDRRGRRWVRHEYMHGTVEWTHWVTGGTYALTTDQMWLKIIREQHRDQCPGLRDCYDHPVPLVERAEITRLWEVVDTSISRDEYQSIHPTFAEAIAAAHQTTGEKR